ncbi:hypothetical protein F4X90_22405 [Candidatus Poribacteria bacterium]|nr:hypothetical protein [Candidatus Poribacteria bacterium]
MTRIISNFVLLAIIILQPSCYISGYQTVNKNPTSQREKKYASHLALEEKYSVYLDATWTTKDAAALLKVFKSMPLGLNLQFSRWHISDEDLENGIKIESKDKLKLVTMSRNIFPVEGSEEVLSPDKDLHYAVVQYITENGTNRSVIELIMQNRYGIDVPSHTALPQRTKNNTPKGYSDFGNDDLMLIMSVLEAFPQALHKTPQLKYIVRRVDMEEKGISSAMISRGYITFAESIFLRDRYHRHDTRKIIAHEKAHFLWWYVFNDQLKLDWAKLGGWFRDSSESGWSTTQERSAFVTEYAYTENPDEDMAESIGFYFVYPDKLRSCCPEKYEFIHNRIMLTYSKLYTPSNLM